MLSGNDAELSKYAVAAHNKRMNVGKEIH